MDSPGFIRPPTLASPEPLRGLTHGTCALFLATEPPANGQGIMDVLRRHWPVGDVRRMCARRGGPVLSANRRCANMGTVISPAFGNMLPEQFGGANGEPLRCSREPRADKGRDGEQ